MVVYVKKRCSLNICCLLLSAFCSLLWGGRSFLKLLKPVFFFSKGNWLGLKLGYESEVEIDRSLKATNQRIKRMETFRYLIQEGVFTANFANRFEVYGKAGAAKFFVEPRVSDAVRVTTETGNRFTWGVGARGIIYEYSKVTVGLDVKYQEASPRFQWMAVNGSPLTSTAGAKLKYQEWQIGLGVSYHVGIFTPYIGGCYCQTLSRYKHFPVGILKEEATSFRVKSKTKFGIALGADLSTGDIFDLNFEARLFDETAVTVAATVRF